MRHDPMERGESRTAAMEPEASRESQTAEETRAVPTESRVAPDTAEGSRVAPDESRVAPDTAEGSRVAPAQSREAERESRLADDDADRARLAHDADDRSRLAAAGEDTRETPVAPAGAPGTHGAYGAYGADLGLVTSVPAQRDAYGGMHFGAAFFGWLAAMGMALVLTAVLAAAGTAVSVATGTTPAEAAQKGADNVQSIGWAGAVVLAVLVFVSYACGGYTAARMARFSGLKQGLAVWLWALLAAIVVAVVAAVAGTKYDVMSQLNSFPRIPVKEGDLSTAGIVALALVAVTSLVGALLGGAAGTGYHRRVDRSGAVDEIVA